MRVAIIGGIGCGKSTVLEAIKELGFAVRSADEINRQLLEDQQYLRLLGAAFPDVVVGGKVDKDSLRAQIFSDPSKRYMLNNIAHPLIRRKIASFNDNPLFVEVPLIVESGMHEDFDELILVRSKMSKRIKRLKQRTRMKGYIRKIIFSQMPEKKLLSFATITINNNGTLDELKQSVKEVVDYIICENKLSESKNVNNLTDTKAKSAGSRNAKLSAENQNDKNLPNTGSAGEQRI